MKYSKENLEKFLYKINDRFESSFKEVKKITEAFIELKDGNRFAINTQCIGIAPSYLSQLEYIIENYIERILAETTGDETLYIRQEWQLQTINPSLICPSTFDLLSEPIPGNYVFRSRFRLLKNGEPLSLKHLNIEKNEGQYIKFRSKYENYI